MARTSRQISHFGFYHVMMRGNEKREIFKDDRISILTIRSIVQ